MKKLAILVCMCLCLAGCGEAGPDGASLAPPAETPSAAPSPTATPTPTPTPTPEPYDFTQPVPESEEVGEDYFADACFIGDSRTEGFRLWSGLEQGEFITHTGLKVFDVYEKTITYQDQEMMLLDALAMGQYGKVYVCLGLNELGYNDDQGYYDNYARLVDDIRAAQPEAVVYIQLVIPVNTQKCKDTGQRDYVTNEKIGVYNELLYQLCEDKQVPLLDPAQAIVDETGEPPYDVTSDGVHFKRAGYESWYQYLRTHTVEREELG